MDFVVGIIVGLILYYVFGERKKTSGVFYILDFHEGLCGVELTDDIISISNKKEITLQVKIDDKSGE